MSRRVLLIVHQEHSNPGRVGRMVGELGFTPVICRHACGDPLPETLDDYAAAVIFGGPMSANDDDLPFVRNELDWIELALRADKPFLGICLGAQLLARQLGAAVGPHPDGYHEIGYYPVRATPEGHSLFAEEQWFYHWHSEGFALPAGAELLASGTCFQNQAFRYGNAYAVQFHPEVTREMMLRWTGRLTHRMVLPGAQARDTQLAGQRCHDDAVDAWVARFMDRWLAPARLAALPPRGGIAAG